MNTCGGIDHPTAEFWVLLCRTVYFKITPNIPIPQSEASFGLFWINVADAANMGSRSKKGYRVVQPPLHRKDVKQERSSSWNTPSIGGWITHIPF